MRAVLVRIEVTPPLLADLLEKVLCADRSLQRWTPGDAAPLVDVVDVGAEELSLSRVTVALGRMRDDPVQVTIDGRHRTVGATPPERLHELVTELAREASAG